MFGLRIKQFFSDLILIKFNDFKLLGIKKINDKTIGKYIYSLHLKFKECHCNDNNFMKMG